MTRLNQRLDRSGETYTYAIVTWVLVTITSVVVVGSFTSLLALFYFVLKPIG